MPTSNILTQRILIYDQAGHAHHLRLSDINDLLVQGVQQCSVAAFQIGASLSILLLLLVLTKPAKRLTPIFLLNCLALLTIGISQILACTYYTSAWFSAYASLTGDFSLVSAADKATSVATSVLVLLTLIVVQASLVLQVHVVCTTLSSAQRAGVLALSILVALTALGFRVAQTVDNIIWNVMRMRWGTSSKWLVQGRDIATAASIAFFSLVFCVKLGWSICERKRLGMRGFGAMHVIFIGGLQTLVVPATFAALHFAVPTYRLNALVLLTVSISLPLTSLWASSATTTTRSTNPAAPGRAVGNNHIHSPDRSPGRGFGLGFGHNTHVAPLLSRHTHRSGGVSELEGVTALDSPASLVEKGKDGRFGSETSSAL